MNDASYGMRNFLVKMPRGYEHFDNYTRKIIMQHKKERFDETIEYESEPKDMVI